MRCRQAGKLISLYVDGGLSARLAAELELHLESCAGCRALLGDFRAITGAAAGLDAGEPGDAVWEKIRAGLAAAGAPAERLSDRTAGVRTGGKVALRPGPAWLRWAGVAASALVLVAVGVLIGTRLERARPAAAGAAGVVAKLDEAERYYHQALRSLGKAFAAARVDLPAEVIEVFEKNLAVVDGTIEACRRAVSQAPENVELRNFLLDAYMDKVNLLDSALSLRPAAAAGRPGPAGRERI